VNPHESQLARTAWRAQSELLERLVATGKPVVVVLANGRPLELGWLDEHVPAIVESWFPGVEAGHGLGGRAVRRRESQR